MENILDRLNSAPLYLICGAIILFVMGFSIFFMVRAYRAGIAIGMDKTKLKRTITSSVTFTILPSISILLGVIALSGTLGIPLPWLRLSVVGSLSYEAIAAENAVSAMGLTLGKIDSLTAQQFVNITLVISFSSGKRTEYPSLHHRLCSEIVLYYTQHSFIHIPKIAILILLQI